MKKWKELVESFLDFKDISDKIESYCEFLETQCSTSDLENNIVMSLKILSELKKNNIKFGFSKNCIQENKFSFRVSIEQLQDLSHFGMDVETYIYDVFFHEIIEKIKNLKDERGIPIKKIIFGRLFYNKNIIDESKQTIDCRFSNFVTFEIGSEFRPVTRLDKLERILNIGVNKIF